MLQILQKYYRNISKNFLFSGLLMFSFGIFLGVSFATFSASYQASLFNVGSSLEQSELDAYFPDYENKKEISISQIASNTFQVEFFATEGEGDSLHPYSFVVTKDGNTLVKIEENIQ